MASGIPDKPRFWRIQNIQPREIGVAKEWLQKQVKELATPNALGFSLAPDSEDTLCATLTSYAPPVIPGNKGWHLDKHFVGFTPVSNPQNAILDIVVVVGLGGHALGSFRSADGKSVWIRDFAPWDVPEARFVTYGYDASVDSSDSKQGIHDIAKTLLIGLVNFRESTGTSHRPLCFVCHSLGGVVLKEALIIADRATDRAHDDWHKIVMVTSGLIFMGVPNLGLNHDQLRIATKGKPNEGFIRDLVQTDGEPSQFFDRLADDFGKLCKKQVPSWKIISYYENKPSLTLEVLENGKFAMTGTEVFMVSKISAGLIGNLVPDFDHLPSNTDHRGLVRFDHRNNERYISLRMNLKQIARRVLQYGEGILNGPQLVDGQTFADIIKAFGDLSGLLQIVDLAARIVEAGQPILNLMNVNGEVTNASGSSSSDPPGRAISLPTSTNEEQAAQVERTYAQLETLAQQRELCFHIHADIARHVPESHKSLTRTFSDCLDWMSVLLNDFENLKNGQTQIQRKNEDVSKDFTLLRSRSIELTHRLLLSCWKEKYNQLPSGIDGKLSDDTVILFARRLANIVAREHESTVETILTELSFKQMHRRRSAIPQAHKKTFAWALTNPEIKLKEWMCSSESDTLYWITGKAGSGKSTLMKFLCEHPKTLQNLKCWADGKGLNLLSFYFWNPGTPLEKSESGLLRGILHQLIYSNRGLAQIAFPDRFSAKPKTSSDATLSMQSLRNAFAAISGQRSFMWRRKSCIFIDGLDEYHGNHLELVRQLKVLNKSPHIKLCVSSRPRNAFVKEYEGGRVPSLQLEHLTKPDILHFIRGSIEALDQDSSPIQHDATNLDATRNRGARLDEDGMSSVDDASDVDEESYHRTSHDSKTGLIAHATTDPVCIRGGKEISGEIPRYTKHKDTGGWDAIGRSSSRVESSHSRLRAEDSCLPDADAPRNLAQIVLESIFPCFQGKHYRRDGQDRLTRRESRDESVDTRRRREDTSDKRERLIALIAGKAEGVFLWVQFVVASVLRGLAEGDTLETLWFRVDAFPTELNDFFSHMLERVEPFYRKQSAQYLRLAYLYSHGSEGESLWEYFWLISRSPEGLRESTGADIDLTAFAMEHPVDLQEDLRKSLVSACRDLLYLPKPSSIEDVGHQSQFSQGRGKHGALTVTWLHRTVYDFLKTKSMQDRLNEELGMAFREGNIVHILTGIRPRLTIMKQREFRRRRWQ